MNEVIEIGGRTFELSYETLSPEQKAEIIQGLQQKYGAAGCGTCGAKGLAIPAKGMIVPSERRAKIRNDFRPDFLSMNPASCPATVGQNTTHTITMTGSGGTPPYTITLYLNDVPKASLPGLTTPSATMNVVFNDPVGTYTVKGEIKDSCSPQQIVTDLCTLNIVISCSALNTVLIPPTSPVIQGAASNFTLTASGGLVGSGYTYELYRVDPTVDTLIDSVTSTSGSVTRSHVFSESPGTYQYYLKVKDTCTPQQVVISNRYTVTVQAACPTLINAALTISP